MPSILLQRQKDDFFRDITSFGSVWFYIFLMFFFLIQKNYALFAKLALGIGIGYVAIVILRIAFFKDRPDKYKYKTLIDKLDAASFPSTHSARVAFLFVLFVNYFNNMVISVFLALIAGIVLYSRIYLKKHDWKDVMGGAIVGILAYFIVSYIL